MSQATKQKPPATGNGKKLRGHLSRAVITRAGLAVAREDGVQNLTMKRLADELAVTPMAIYRHFEDKSDLIDAVLDSFVQEQNICGHSVPDKNWTKW
ncbi:MAG: TetR/AcrR family transcriptional regulator, partial [Gammaproteobacteria bacterium]|nr:TetR/AcrR family transcriptional regulator [Gammaproteobacteria bacterium]